MSKAVRCLFAISDNDRKKLNQDLDNQLRELDQAETEYFKKTYGFDPTTGKAVEGSGFEITLMDRKSMPSMYTSSYRRKPSRPQSVLRAQSPARRNYVTLSSAPTKRKLLFDDDDSGSNDENQDISEKVCCVPRKQAKTDSVISGLDLGVNEVVSSAASSVFNPLSSPPTSPSSSSLHFNSPRSPSVLSSSCPPVFETEPCSEHTDVPGLSRSLSTSSLLGLSPETQAREYATPTVRPKLGKVKLVQREITDYGRVKKHASSLKASPRS